MSPPATNAILVAVLAVTLAAVAEVLRRTLGDELEPEVTGAFLTLFTAFFGLRVAGQLLVKRAAPRWLPPMEQWNLLPYRLLLPIQLLFLAVMSFICVSLLADAGLLADRHRGFGVFAIGLSVVYAGSMAVRYAVRMRRRPGQRWFGGAIPIVFHVVLAAFVFTLGAYHAAD
jgi:uncharacterized protein